MLILCLVGSVGHRRAQGVKTYCLGLHGTYSMEGDVKKSKTGFGIQAESILNENLSVELALSSFSDEYADEYSYYNEYIGENLASGTGSLKLNLTTIGISSIYRISFAPGGNVYLLGGINYNIVDLSGSLDGEVLGYSLHANLDSDLSNEIGYHIGAGLNFPLMDNWNLFAEYRYTFLKLKGDFKWDATMYFEEYSETEHFEISEKFDSDYDFGLVKIGIKYIF